MLIPEMLATTVRKTFEKHPYIAAVTGLRERLPGEPRDRVQAPYLSPSQIKSLQRCGVAYYFKYGMGRKETSKSKAFFGSCVHVGSEVFFRLIRAARLAGSPLDYPAFAAEAMKTAGAYARQRLPKPIFWDPVYYRGPLETQESLVAGVMHAVERLALETWYTLEPATVERGYFIEWRNPDVMPVIGYPDLVHVIGDEHAVMDNKTGSEKKELATELDCGLIFYAMGHELFTGITTRRASYSNYIRNKEPRIGTTNIRITNDQFERAYLRAALATDTINEGIYAPADDDMICKPCQFREGCKTWLTLRGRERIAKAQWPEPSVESDAPLILAS